MRWPRAVRDAVIELFVDDRGFAAAILAWLALGWLGVATLGVAPAWAGIALFAGLATVLAGAAIRAARRRHARR